MVNYAEISFDFSQRKFSEKKSIKVQNFKTELIFHTTNYCFFPGSNVFATIEDLQNNFHVSGSIASD